MSVFNSHITFIAIYKKHNGLRLDPLFQGCGFQLDSCFISPLEACSSLGVAQESRPLGPTEASCRDHRIGTHASSLVGPSAPELAVCVVGRGCIYCWSAECGGGRLGHRGDFALGNHAPALRQPLARHSRRPLRKLGAWGPEPVKAFTRPWAESRGIG